MQPSGGPRKRVDYEVALVTYIDILGFKELIDTKTAGQISRIIRVVKEVLEPERFKKAERISTADFVNFSDLTLASIPLRDGSVSLLGAVFYQLLHIVRAQSLLIRDEGIIVRGGVTVGNIVKSYGQLFGPAVVEAYELESQVAKYPRVVVGKKVFEELQENAKLWAHDRDDEIAAVRGLLREGDDGQLFVDYLRVIRDELEDPEDFVAHHGQFIADRLALHANRPSVRSKYEWMEYYHRTTVLEWKRGLPA